MSAGQDARRIDFHKTRRKGVFAMFAGTFMLDQNQLKALQGLQKSYAAGATGEYKNHPVLQSIRVHTKGGLLTAWATDRYTLGRMRFRIDKENRETTGDETSVLLSKELLANLVRAVGTRGLVKVTDHESGNVRFDIADYMGNHVQTLTCSPIDGEWPAAVENLVTRQAAKNGESEFALVDPAKLARACSVWLPGDGKSTVALQIEGRGERNPIRLSRMGFGPDEDFLAYVMPMHGERYSIT